jgi:ABC-type transport system involved in multi-copper enzyme maturation permease subunit
MRVGRLVSPKRVVTMTLPAFLFAAQKLFAETRAQARSAGLTIGMVVVTCACVIFCLGVSISGEAPQLTTRPWEAADLIPKAEAERLKMAPDAIRAEGVDVPTGELSLFFGMVRVPLQRQSGQTVRLIEIILAGGLADTIGILLALVWTASFLPGLLESASASVLLAKPTPRYALVVGKVGGILVSVALQALAFVTLTWLALGLRTGTWDVRYFLAVPILIIHFGIFLSISALLAVVTRSPVACALGTTLIWAVCFGINLVRHDAVLASGSAYSRPLLEAAYWVAPKPLDYNLILADSLQAGEFFGSVINVRQLNEQGGFAPELSIATGLAFAAAMMSLAGWRLARTDY